MYFNHIYFPEIIRPFVEQIESPTGHYYKTKNGDIYPSITTVLRMLSNDGIQKWRSIVGNIQADRISKESTDVGTRLHEIINNYLNNTETKPFLREYYAISPDALFTAIKPALMDIDNIHALETKLYSDKMGIAGTVDCIAEYEGILSVIDFKNSRKPKTKSRIKSYILQEAAYALMWEECIGTKIEQGVTIIGNWDGTYSIFKTKPLSSYVDELWNLLVNYEKSLLDTNI